MLAGAEERQRTHRRELCCLVRSDGQAESLDGAAGVPRELAESRPEGRHEGAVHHPVRAEGARRERLLLGRVGELGGGLPPCAHHHRRRYQLWCTL